MLIVCSPAFFPVPTLLCLASVLREPGTSAYSDCQDEVGPCQEWKLLYKKGTDSMEGKMPEFWF